MERDRKRVLLRYVLCLPLGGGACVFSIYIVENQCAASLGRLEKTRARNYDDRDA